MKTKLATLLSGNILAQVIPLVALPLLARMYTPEEFGSFALYVTICSMVSLISGARFDVAIIAATKTTHKSLLNRLSLVFIFGATLLTILVCLMLWHQALISIDWLLLLPAGISGAALFNLSNNIRNADETYGKLTLNMTSRSAIWVAISILMQDHYYGLLIAFAGSYWLVALLNTGNIYRLVRAAQFKPRLLLPVVHKYRQYPLFNAPHALLTSTNLNIPNLLLPTFGQIAFLGAYGQANKILITPWLLIGNALFKIYFKTTTVLVEKQQLILPAFGKFIFAYAVLLLPIFGAGYWLVEPFIVLLLGDEWQIAGKIGVLLLPWIYLRAIGGILAFVPLILSLQKAAFLFEIGYSVFMAACMAISLQFLSPLHSIQYFALTGASFVLVQVIWYLIAVAKHDQNLQQTKPS